MFFSDALIAAQRKADESRAIVWIREVYPGKWVTSERARGYYDSTEHRVDPQ